jgi:molybdenum cofactor cytidylyltransferase
MIVGVLLAAGGSTRFGSQKLVAPLRGAPLVRHAALGLASVTDVVIAVVGNDADAVRAALGDSVSRVIENRDWREGQSTSLRCGVEAVSTDTAAIIIGLGDQPDVHREVVPSLIAKWRSTGLPIVTARYRGVRAPPVLLAREVFPEIEQLRGDTGAKPLMDAKPERVAYVDVDAPVPRDIDTPDDLAAADR